MKPSEKLDLPIIGEIITRKIDKIAIEGDFTSVPEERVFELLDEMVTHQGKIYIVNEWGDAKKEQILFIHKHFVKEVHRRNR